MPVNFSDWQPSTFRLVSAALVFCCVFVSTFYRTDKVGAVANTPDYTFGTNGKVTTDIASYQTAALDVAIQTDGKIVVAGYVDFASQPGQFAVTRYNTDGSLDSSFDGDGILTAQFRVTGEYTASYGRSVAIQPDGKIVVAGDSFLYTGGVGTTDFGVARLNPDGSFDTSFDLDGRINFSLDSTPHDQAYDVAVQSSGKIIIAGIVGNGFNTYSPALARLNQDGSFDTTFFDDGIIAYTGEINGFVTALLIQTDGKFNMIANVSSSSGGLLIARYNADGTPDMTFGGGGRLYTSGDPRAAALQPDGKIVIGSYISGIYLDQRDFLLSRYNSNGSRDSSFGDNGTVITHFLEYTNWLEDLAIQPDGKIVAVGFANTEGGSFGVASDFAMARYNADGSLDTTFDLDGKVIASLGLRREFARAVAIQPNGKILMVGTAGQSNETGKAALLRFMGDVNTADFDGDTRTDISVFRPATGAWYLSQSASGFGAVNFGVESDKIVAGDYTGDGRTDVAVFRPSTGVWHILRSENSAYNFTHFGTSGDIPVPADYDGDGRIDIAVFRPSTGVWYRINSFDASVSAVQFGIAEDKPVAGDFDGDGRGDINIFRSSNGGWYRLNSSNGQFSATRFGAGADIPVSADFDGDSRNDVVVFRPSNGTWYWMKSSDGNFQAIAFGQNGDVPAAADYDGDGKSDVAVFRPSLGAWYLNRSTAGFAGILFGQSGDQPIPF